MPSQRNPDHHDSGVVVCQLGHPSDVAAFIEHTRDAVELGQDQAVVLTADGRRPTPTRRGRRPYGSASSQTGSQKPCVWPRFAMHRIAAA
jgi:hypothetical protein